MKTQYTGLLLFLIATLMAGCDTTKTIYQSSTSKKNYWKVEAYTMSHCGCTELIAKNYEGGRLSFQIWYTDGSARKSVYKYDEKGKIIERRNLVAEKQNPEILFSESDKEIFERIKEIIEGDELVYPMKWTEYAGFISE